MLSRIIFQDKNFQFLTLKFQIEFLSQWGGETSAKVTRRILSELFDSTLGRQFNYTGGGTLNKRSFSALELHDKVVGI